MLSLGETTTAPGVPPRTTATIICKIFLAIAIPATKMGGMKLSERSRKIIGFILVTGLLILPMQIASVVSGFVFQHVALHELTINGALVADTDCRIVHLTRSEIWLDGAPVKVLPLSAAPFSWGLSVLTAVISFFSLLIAESFFVMILYDKTPLKKISPLEDLITKDILRLLQRFRTP